MARKQTLKSLLGANDSRVEVDLNLDEQTFRAPTVRAGNYQVAGPVYSKTNALSQLSDSLERYSGPILKGYANIKEQQSLAMADATELLTTEQLKLLNDGDTSGLTESINNDKRQIDEAQRKKLITFAENPNNYERAYRRVGSRVAGVFVEDYLTNMDKYAEDESFDFQTKADELAEQYGLTGLGEQEFYKQINSISESTKARFGELKNAHMVRTDKAEAIADQSMQMINGTFNTDVMAEGGIYDALAGKILTQQEDIILGMVTKLAVEHPKKALELIESYETGVIALGNGKIRDEFATSLEDAFGNAQNRQAQLAEIVERKRNDSITEFQAAYSNAIALGQDLPESTDIFINDGLTITVDTSEAKNAADVATAVADAVAAIPEDDKSISEGTKALIVRQFSDEVVKEQQRVITNRSNAGVNVASSQFMDFLDVKDSEGNTVYEGMDTELDRANQTQEWLEELNPIIDAIYADPELDPAQKDAKAKMARMTFVAEKKTDHDTFVSAKEDSIKALRFEDDTGGDRQGNVQGILDNFFASTELDGDPMEALQDGQTYLEQSRVFDAETDRLREEIRNREMTDEEIASGMTSEQFYQKKIKEAKDLNADREALLQADLAADRKLDGKTTEAQQTDNALKKQEAIPKELKNVEIGDGTSGFASSKAGGPKAQDPTWVKGNKAKNLVEDINAKQGIGTEFKIGLFDNLRLDWITRNLPQEIDTIHKANQVRAIKFQQQGEEYMKADKGQGVVAEFITGETMTRVIREGDAGMTLDELSKGDIRGVKFDPTTLNQSATPIVPFDLVNKALTNQDMSPTEEAALRDYADLLYDSSELDEAGKTTVLQKMVELQVNAYAQIGFRFAK